jgi:hypothetical protein
MIVLSDLFFIQHNCHTMKLFKIVDMYDGDITEEVNGSMRGQ